MRKRWNTPTKHGVVKQKSSLLIQCHKNGGLCQVAYFKNPAAVENKVQAIKATAQAKFKIEKTSAQLNVYSTCDTGTHTCGSLSAL